MKKKSQSAIGQVPQAAVPQNYAQPPVPQAVAPVGGFHYNGAHYPLPQGWDGLSMDDWFFKFETVRERMMHVDNEQLPPMTDGVALLESLSGACDMC